MENFKMINDLNFITVSTSSNPVYNWRGQGPSKLVFMPSLTLFSNFKINFRGFHTLFGRWMEE